MSSTIASKIASPPPISALDDLGIHVFDGFDVIGYAVSPANKEGTSRYSYRLFRNLGAGREFARCLKNIRRPAVVLVGSADEQNVADQFVPLFQSLGVKIPVTIVPDMTHVDMIANPTALKAVVSTIGAQR